MPKISPGSSSVLHSNKVYQVLKSLDASEHKRLVKFLQSPYFNQSKNLIRLYEVFIKNIEGKKDGFDRVSVWKNIFPNQAYDDVNFRKYCSDLLKLIEKFMCQEVIEQDETKQMINTLDYVVKHKIEPLCNSAFRQARARIQSDSYRTLSFYYNAYAIERQYYAMSDFDVKLDVRPNIEEISFNLDIFYWIEKLKIYIAVISQKKTRSYQYALNFMDEITRYLQNFPMEKTPELSLYYYSFLTLYDESNTEYYYGLKKLLDIHGQSMPQKESVELYDLALHYCTGKLNQGNKIFLQEYFDLFDQAMNRKIFIVNGHLAPWRFNNVIGVALGLGKIDWAEQFVENYKNVLPIETRENSYAFNLARVYRFQGKYDKVLKLLRNLEYEDIGYNLISKMMLAMTYYELDEVDALDSFIESFRVFLNRHKNIPAQRRKSYLNLIKYVRRLTRTMPGDKTAIEKLRQEIVHDKASTVNHEWLLEKIAELE